MLHTRPHAPERSGRERRQRIPTRQSCSKRYALTDKLLSSLCCTWLLWFPYGKRLATVATVGLASPPLTRFKASSTMFSWSGVLVPTVCARIGLMTAGVRAGLTEMVNLCSQKRNARICSGRTVKVVCLLTQATSYSDGLLWLTQFTAQHNLAGRLPSTSTTFSQNC